MSPYLTARGRWLLLSGSIFLFMGALLSRPLIIFMGEIQVALVALGFLLFVPSAVAVDRRCVRIEVDSDAEDTPVSNLTGDPVTLDVRVVNESGVTLHALRAQPFGAESLECEPLDEIQALCDTATVLRGGRCCHPRHSHPRCGRCRCARHSANQPPRPVRR